MGSEKANVTLRVCHLPPILFSNVSYRTLPRMQAKGFSQAHDCSSINQTCSTQWQYFRISTITSFLKRKWLNSNERICMFATTWRGNNNNITINNNTNNNNSVTVTATTTVSFLKYKPYRALINTHQHDVDNNNIYNNMNTNDNITLVAAFPTRVSSAPLLSPL